MGEGGESVWRFVDFGLYGVLVEVLEFVGLVVVVVVVAVYVVVAVFVLGFGCRSCGEKGEG